MSGSIKWFEYVTDSGDNFALRRDESLTEEVNGTGSDYTPSSTAVYAIPSNVKPRYALYIDGSGLVSRKVTVMTAAKMSSLPATISDGGLTLGLSTSAGERITRPVSVDTGLVDGDNT